MNDDDFHLRLLVFVFGLTFACVMFGIVTYLVGGAVIDWVNSLPKFGLIQGF